MKIIFLNSWYAKAGNGYFEFIKRHSKTTDVFAFSEISPELFINLKNLLPEFNGLYEENGYDSGEGRIYGQAIFCKKGLVVKNKKRIKTYRSVSNDRGFAVFLDLEIDKKEFVLMNLHGKARPGHKLDTPTRIRQSKTVLDFLKNKKGINIIGGDFNLLPDTKSVGLFEDARYRNLIKEYNIKDTRGILNHKKYNGKDIQNFADYCFVSQSVKVNSFEVPNVAISDHLPLMLDFEL